MGVILNVTIPILCMHMCLVSSLTSEELTAMPGHLKEFGFGENSQSVPEVDGFPSTKEFFQHYFYGSKPVIMKNAAKLSPAFLKWTDDHILSLDEFVDDEIPTEVKRKENGSQLASHMSFNDHVRIYNNTDQYMVNGIPPMIQHDFILPGPLQCEPIARAVLVDALICLSSRETKSVIHTDSFDDIICVIRGEKTLVAVDPEKYARKFEKMMTVDDVIYHEWTYSSIDVDAVDFIEFPDLVEVEYYHGRMYPGDCIYIPYKWIHQIRSFGSNLAVNVWWDHQMTKQIDLDECPDQFDPEFTMDKVKLIGFDSAMTGVKIREHFLDITKRGALVFTGTLRSLVQDYEGLSETDREKRYQAIREIFELLDADGDGLATSNEIEMISEEGWEKVSDYMDDFEDIVTMLKKVTFGLHERPKMSKGTPDDVSENDAPQNNDRIEL